MGALTSNQKRPSSFDNQISYQYFPDCRVLEKPRISSMQHSPEKPILSYKSAVSRLSKYPEAKPSLPRQIHAPCRTLKFGLLGLRPSPDSKSNSTGVSFSTSMGNFLYRQYDNAKKMALDSLRYTKKDDEVIDRGKQEAVSDDSSIEQVELIGELQESYAKIVGHRSLQPSSSSSSVVNDRSLGAENVRKMIHSPSLSPDGVEALDAKDYEALLQDAERRTANLNILEFDTELNEKRCQAVHTLPSPKKLEEKPLEKVPGGPFVLLTKEERKEVGQAFSADRKWKVLVSHETSNIDITGQILQCLRPREWLNDEVINLYLELLKERESREPKKFLRCHYFNTFFYKKLIGNGNGYNYKAVRRWTTENKLGYFLDDCDKIFVPIHQEAHWCLAVINKKDQKLQYLDSLKGKDANVLHVLARYIIDEVKDKRGEDIDLSSWEFEYVEDLPKQMNGFDCGMFMLKYIDFYSRGIGLCFDQKHMSYFRMRTAKEILRLRAD